MSFIRPPRPRTNLRRDSVRSSGHGRIQARSAAHHALQVFRVSLAFDGDFRSGAIDVAEILCVSAQPWQHRRFPRGGAVSSCPGSERSTGFFAISHASASCAGVTFLRGALQSRRVHRPTRGWLSGPPGKSGERRSGNPCCRTACSRRSSRSGSPCRGGLKGTKPMPSSSSGGRITSASGSAPPEGVLAL